MPRRSTPPPPKANSLVASAAVMSQRPESMSKVGKSESWQEDAWRFYDTVGELRFGIGWLSNGMSRVNLVAAWEPQSTGDEPAVIIVPEPAEEGSTVDLAATVTTDDMAAVDLVSAIAGGADGQGQMMAAASTLLSVPGIGYILMESSTPTPDVPLVPGDTIPTPDETWTWRVIASDELRAQGDTYEIATGPSSWRPVALDHVLIRVWRPHARRSWDADSPCRAVNGVLRQIALLDEHIQATAVSRLAGAGLLVMPSEAEFAPMPRQGQAPTSTDDGEPSEDDFVDVLVDTMTIPIGDRGTAAAVVPLVVRIPGEHADKVQHITFWSEFNDNLLPLRENAIKRLALGMDMPPEVLLGVAGMNHWGAWQVEETAITLHIEPMAETICHALTIGFLRPALAAAGVQDPSQYMVWYDTTDLTTRPDRSDDTMAAYDRLEASGAALRREAGLSEDDAPSDDEKRFRILLDVAKGAPTMAPAMLAAAGVLEPEVADAAEPVAGAAPAPAAPAAPEGEQQGPPAEQPTTPEAQSLAVLEGCDGLVSRALERAGTRLRSAVGRGTSGGAASVSCPDPASLHVTLGGATKYAQLDQLLAGAWVHVPALAARYDIDADALTRTLDSYVRALLATGNAHDRDRLSDALGLTSVPG